MPIFSGFCKAEPEKIADDIARQASWAVSL
jgi:hypothetical protein